MMEKLNSPQQLKSLIRQVSESIPKEVRFTNCIFLESQLADKIQSGMFYSLEASGLNLFEKKINSFQLTGVWRTDGIPEIEPPLLPLVLDLDYSGQMKERQRLMYQQLQKAGFVDLGPAQKMRLDFSLLDSKRLDTNVYQAQENDLPEICALWNAALCNDPQDLGFSEKEIWNWIQKESIYCLRDTRGLLGAVMCEIASGSCIIWHLAVDSRCRGEGIGGHLLTTALEHSRSRGAKNSWIWVKVDNKTAISFYGGMRYNSLAQFTHRLIRR